MRNYRNLLEKRVERIQKANSDQLYRRDLLLECASDDLLWFDTFAWTYDPRNKIAKLPLMLYEGQQVEYLRYLESLLKNPRDGFVDKPRDVGITVITMNFLLKHWLMDDFFNARVGSRKEDYVDSAGDPDTLFYKLDYTIRELPAWMKPQDFRIEKNRTYLKLTNPANDNTITGESANPSFARGGRQTIVLFDEFGFWGWARPAWESAGDVTKIRLAVTTPPDNGKTSHAYKLIAGLAGKVDVFSIDYSAIPAKGAEWLKEQRGRRSKEEFEREILKSYTGSMEGKVYLSEWQKSVKLSDVNYNPNLPLFISWDFGLDTTALIWWQKDMAKKKLYIIDCYSNVNKSIDFYIPFVTGQAISGTHIYTQEDISKIQSHVDFKKDVSHFGDPNVDSRSVITGSSTQTVLNKYNIYVTSKPWGGRSHRDLREKTILMLRYTEVDQRRCAPLIDAMENARYPRRSEDSQSTAEVNKPIHDYTSHYRTAVEYFADNEPQYLSREEEKIEPIRGYRPNGGY